MSDSARRTPSTPDPAPAIDEEGSSIRSHGSAPRPRQDSAPVLRSERRPTRPGSGSSTRPGPGSLDDRMEQKARAAAELLRNLPATDARVRLLHIALMRRDESLLDGVLGELNKP